MLVDICYENIWILKSAPTSALSAGCGGRGTGDRSRRPRPRRHRRPREERRENCPRLRSSALADLKISEPANIVYSFRSFL